MYFCDKYSLLHWGKKPDYHYPSKGCQETINILTIWSGGRFSTRVSSFSSDISLAGDCSSLEAPLTGDRTGDCVGLVSETFSLHSSTYFPLSFANYKREIIRKTITEKNLIQAASTYQVRCNILFSCAKWSNCALN